MIPFRHIGLAYALLAIIVFLGKRPLRLADRIAALLVLALSMPLLVSILTFEMTGMRIPAPLAGFQAWPLLYGPLLYLFARSEIDEKPSLKKTDLLHLVPFVIAAILLFAMPVPHPDHAGPPPEHPWLGDTGGPAPDMPPPPLPGHDMTMQRHFGGPQGPHPGGAPPPPPGEHPGTFGIILGIATAVSFLGYTVLLLVLLARHRRSIPEYFSYYSGRLNLRWLRWLTICFIIAYSFVLLSTRLAPGMYSRAFAQPGFFPDIAITFFIFIFSFFGIKQRVIYSNGGISYEDTESGGDRKYEKSGLKECQAKEYIEKIDAFMKREEPYLDSALTIADVSAKLGIPRHHLTQALNGILRKNFFMYINEYRVSEAKRRMRDNNFSDHTVLRIALDSGFNSKSGFNAIFKKITGETPTHFRAAHSPGNKKAFTQLNEDMDRTDGMPAAK